MLKLDNEQVELIKQVMIPACPEHEGLFSLAVVLVWECPVCHERRGPITDALSYDGSRRLVVSGWVNPCGHVDKYAALIDEARDNGLNDELVEEVI